jgi:hypothetical protein
MDRNRRDFDGVPSRGFWAGVGLLCVSWVALTLWVASTSEFRARSLEIEGITEESPVTAEWVEKTVALKAGYESIFLLSLRPMQERLLQNPWVKEAIVQRVPPGTVKVALRFRDPQYLVQSSDGSIQYMDSEANLFGHPTPQMGMDFPVLAGIRSGDVDRRREAILVLEEWKKAVGQDGARLHGLPTVEQLSWSEDQGYRLIVAETPTSGTFRQKIAVELGPWQPADFPIQLTRLQSVLKYIREHQVPVRQIWADAGKKIVVKVGRGS